MNRRTLSTTLVTGLFAATSLGLAASPSHAEPFVIDLENTVFGSKTAINVSADYFDESASAAVRQIRAAADGRSCTTTALACVIGGMSSSRATTVTVVGLDVDGNVVASGSKRLSAVKRIKKTRVILCKRSGNQHEVQVAGLPFNESSKMKARVKLSLAGKSLPNKWRTTTGSSWVNLGSLKSGRSYKYKAQAWNVNGWGPAVSGTLRAGRGCQ